MPGPTVDIKGFNPIKDNVSDSLLKSMEESSAHWANIGGHMDIEIFCIILGAVHKLRNHL